MSFCSGSSVSFYYRSREKSSKARHPLVNLCHLWTRGLIIGNWRLKSEGVGIFILITRPLQTEDLSDAIKERLDSRRQITKFTI